MRGVTHHFYKYRQTEVHVKEAGYDHYDSASSTLSLLVFFIF
jgi:hypothetical protein